METKDTNNEEKKWEGDLNLLKTEGEVAEEEPKVIKAPLFLMFAEYMGYVSKLIEEANSWCEGKKPHEYVARLIEIEAFNIFKDMKEFMDNATIKENFDNLYEVILSSYDEELKKLDEKEIKSSYDDFANEIME